MTTRGGVVRQVLQGGVGEQVPAISVGQLVVDRAGQEDALQHRAHIDSLAGKGTDRRDQPGLQGLGHPIRKVELGPAQSQQGGGDRAARDAGDAIEPHEIAQLVEPPQHPEMKDHRPVAAAGQAQRNARPGLPGSGGIDRRQRHVLPALNDRHLPSFAGRLPTTGPAPAGQTSRRACTDTVRGETTDCFSIANECRVTRAAVRSTESGGMASRGPPRPPGSPRSRRGDRCFFTQNNKRYRPGPDLGPWQRRRSGSESH